MANKYLQIEFKSGNLFEYSKEQKEGFEEHKNSKGNVSYRKYYKEGIFGVYKGTTLRDTDFGKEVSIFMVDGNGDNNFISFPLFDQSKNIAAYAESLITVLPSMEQNYVYRIFPYTMEKEGSKYKSYGVSVKHADITDKTVREDFPLARLTYTYTNKSGELVNGDVPAVVWKENFDGSKIKDQFEKNKFLHEVLVKYASESVKVSNKVTGGEAPRPYGQQATKAPTEQPKKEEVSESVKGTVAYEQEQPKVENQKSSKVDLPF